MKLTNNSWKFAAVTRATHASFPLYFRKENGRKYSTLNTKLKVVSEIEAFFVEFTLKNEQLSVTPHPVFTT